MKQPRKTKMNAPLDRKKVLANKDLIAEAVRKLTGAFCDLLQDKTGLGSCLLSSVAASAILNTLGVRSKVRAGTMMWPRIKPQEDDGVCATHFSYVFEPDSPETFQRIAANLLPELHVWLEVEGKIVDFTTGDLPNQCRRILDLPWTAEPPPPYLWTAPDKLPAGVIYEADPRATKVAWAYGVRLLATLQLAQMQMSEAIQNN